MVAFGHFFGRGLALVYVELLASPEELPVEDVVFQVNALACRNVLDQLVEGGVVGLCLEAELFAVLNVVCELRWAKFDLYALWKAGFLCLCEATPLRVRANIILPWQAAVENIVDEVAERKQVISSRQLQAFV